MLREASNAATLDFLLERFGAKPFREDESGVKPAMLRRLEKAGYINHEGELYSISPELVAMNRDIYRIVRMERTKETIRRWLKIWIFLALCGFALLDIATFSNTTAAAKWLKFSVIAACFVLSLLIEDRMHDLRDRLTIQVAAGLTLVADFVIGILDSFMIGLGLFVLVHAIYSFRHLRGFKEPTKEAILAVCIFALAAGILYFAAPITKAAGMFIPSLIYGVFLSASLYAGTGVVLRSFFPQEDRREIFAGLICFFIADILVAMNAGFTGEAKSWTGVFTWFFYLPAQYFLCMSGYRRNPVV